MSGSSGGGYTGGDDTGDFDCTKLVDTTQLSSPNPQVVSTLQVNQHLDVQLIQRGTAPTLVAIAPGNQTAGSLMPSKMARLIKCIQAGHQYVASVVSINGGQVLVEIRHR